MRLSRLKCVHGKKSVILLLRNIRKMWYFPAFSSVCKVENPIFSASFQAGELVRVSVPLLAVFRCDERSVNTRKTSCVLVLLEFSHLSMSLSPPSVCCSFKRSMLGATTVYLINYKQFNFRTAKTL